MALYQYSNQTIDKEKIAKECLRVRESTSWGTMGKIYRDHTKSLK
jgi:hypothetical protein